MICFWHGKAISENQRRINGKGRVMARDAYEAFMDSITWVCKANFPKFEGPVSVRLFMVLNRKTDAQAVIKPCLDALELAGVIDNDRQVTHFSYYRETARANHRDRRHGGQGSRQVRRQISRGGGGEEFREAQTPSPGPGRSGAFAAGGETSGSQTGGLKISPAGSKFSAAAG
jgi:Holliday junction resolvase RusA-like endonuclease